MSVQYKSEDGWKNISTSSNNAVDTVENGNMNPVTSNAVYDALQYKVDKSSIVDTISDGNMNPVTANAVYDRLKPKVWTSSINIGTSAWNVIITRSVDMVHVCLRCTATGTVTAGTNVAFPNAPAWCRIRHVVSVLDSSNKLLDLQIDNSVIAWSDNYYVNSEWNATQLAYDAVV